MQAYEFINIVVTKVYVLVTSSEAYCNDKFVPPQLLLPMPMENCNDECQEND